MPSSRGFSPPRDWTHVFCSSCITGRFFSAEPSGRPIALSYLGANNNVLQCPWILWWSSGYGSVLSLPMAQVRFQVRELRSHKLWKKRKKVKSLSCVWLFATPWTVVHQAPPSMEFSRQEYWSGLPFPSPISYEVWSKKKKKKGFPGGASGKEPSCQCKRNKRHGFDSWVRKIPWKRAWQPTPVCLPGKSQGQRSLVGYSP